MAKKLGSLLVVSCFLIFFTSSIKADELLDVQNQINKKNSQLTNTEKTLERLKKDIVSLSSGITGTQADLEKAKVQAEEVRKELDKTETSLSERRESLSYLIEVRNKQIRAIYQNPQRTNLELFLTQDLTGFTEMLSYQSQVFNDSRNLVKAVNEEVVSMEKDQTSLRNSKTELENLVAALDARYKEQKQSLASAASRQVTLSKGLDLIKSDITRALIRKSELDEQRRGSFSGAPPVPFSQGPPGTVYYFFYGIGKYSSMGHGIGMSQWGAKGYAQKGWSATSILQKYYTGVNIGGYTQPGTIRVRIYSSCTSSNLLREEVMDFNTYLKGVSEMFSDWPLEAQKAQAIAARTYAIRVVNNKGFIEGNTYDQCYTGNTSRAIWNQAVDQTNGLVVTSGGSLAATYYSASHGGHSENNENVWQGWTGSGYQGYPVSYLRGVSDADSGGVGPNDNWGWNTKYSYTLPQIRQILRKQGLIAAENAWIDSRVGTLTGLGIERGVSGRVAWVVLYGTSGTAKIPGMVFRASFNSFPADGSPAVNGDDAMFSVNFSIGNQVK